MVSAGHFVFIPPKVMRPHPEWPEGDQIRGDRSCPQSIVSRAGLRSSHELGSARPHRRRFFLWAGSIVMGVAAPGGVSPPSGPRSPPNRVANGMKPRRRQHEIPVGTNYTNFVGLILASDLVQGFSQRQTWGCGASTPAGPSCSALRATTVLTLGGWSGDRRGIPIAVAWVQRSLRSLAVRF